MSTSDNNSNDSAKLSEMDAENALFEGKINGLIATFRSDQRPLQGLAGLLDWRFLGAISKYLKSGFLTGKLGECAYLPLTRAGHTYHVLLVGVGTAEESSMGLPAESASALKKNLTSLKIEKIGASRSDLGKGISALKGAPVCIVR